MDHLVNNAGIIQSKLFKEYSEKLSDLAPIMVCTSSPNSCETHRLMNINNSYGHVRNDGVLFCRTSTFGVQCMLHILQFHT